MQLIFTLCFFVFVVHLCAATCWLWAKAFRGWSYVYSWCLQDCSGTVLVTFELFVWSPSYPNVWGLELHTFIFHSLSRSGNWPASQTISHPWNEPLFAQADLILKCDIFSRPLDFVGNISEQNITLAEEQENYNGIIFCVKLELLNTLFTWVAICMCQIEIRLPKK